MAKPGNEPQANVPIERVERPHCHSRRGGLALFPMDALNQTLTGLGHAIRELVHEIRHQSDNQKILHRIEQMESRILSEIKGAKDAELKAMTKDLEKSSAPLAQAVAENK